MTIERAFTIKQGQTWPPVRGRLWHDDGKRAIGLSPLYDVVGVSLVGQGAGTGAVFVATLDILDDGTEPNKGRWQWVPTAEQSAVIDLYDLEFHVDYGGGRVEPVPNKGFYKLRIEGSLVAAAAP